MALSYKTTLRNARLDAFTAALTSTSRLLCYTGSMPSKTATPTGTLLFTLTLLATFAPGASGGVLTATLTSGIVASVAAVASGTPQYYRIIDGTVDDGTHTQEQGDAAVLSGSINFASAVTIGGTVTLSSYVKTEGNA